MIETKMRVSKINLETNDMGLLTHIQILKSYGIDDEHFFEYDDAGNVIKHAFRKIVHAYEYDDKNRMIHEVVASDGIQVSDITYGYDDHGYITKTTKMFNDRYSHFTIEKSDLDLNLVYTETHYNHGDFVVTCNYNRDKNEAEETHSMRKNGEIVHEFKTIHPLS